jgi:transposase
MRLPWSDPVPASDLFLCGPVAKSDAHSLWERPQRHEDAVLYLTGDPHVHLTNNRAERDLRMSKVKQKVSGCLRTGQLPRPAAASPANCRP